MKGVLRTRAQTIGNNKENKPETRKTLQVLQPSAEDYYLLVPSPSMVNRTAKELVKVHDGTFTVLDEASVEKENAAVLRRSKRKNADLEEKPKMGSSKEDIAPATKSQKSKNSKPVSKSKKVPVAKTLETVPEDANQSRSHSFFSVPSKLNEQEESSTELETLTLVKEDLAACIPKTVSEEVNLLTSEVPSEAYWKDLAEQRRLALEQALYENAVLVDQLVVLESENGQLKSTLKECEKVIEIVNASLH